MKINTMKLKLTALLLVLYTGLYAQNKIVLTAPRLDTSSLSNRINLKANTNLNNVNGVLSSTYGGAGIINGILKANGSGVVSPVIASDITTLISGTYLPLTGGTLTGALSGTSAAFSGVVEGGGTVRATGATGGLSSGSGVEIRNNGGIGEVFAYNRTTPAYLPLKIDGSYISLGSASSGNVLIKTTFDNGTDDLQVAGSGLFTGQLNTADIVATASVYQPLTLRRATNTVSTAVEMPFQFLNASSAYETYSHIRSYIVANTASAVSGGLRFTTLNAGSQVLALQLDNTGAITASSSVTAGGILKGVGFNQPISVKTANYTLTASDHTVMFNNAAGNLTATLPAGVEGRIYVIGYLDTNNNLTITPNGSETIGGAASFTLQLSTCLGAITIQFLSGNWYIISTNYNASCL